jgi:thymidylate synthase
MKANKNDLHESGRPLTKEEFINKIKTDDEFAKKWGELGKIYGHQWRSWGPMMRDIIPLETGGYIYKGPIDQIQNLINDLKTNPDSRRLMVNAWNVGELDQMVLPPCHYGFQVYTRELSVEERYNLIEKDKHTQFVNWQSLGTDRVKELLDEKNIPTRAISLMWNQRSVDTPLGLPFNIASYALLLEIIAKTVNMVPDELIGNLGDCHIYKNQIDGVIEQIGRERTYEEMVEIYNQLENKKDRDGYWTWETRFEDNDITKRTREPFPLPTLTISNQINFNEGIDEFLNSCLISDFIIEGYKSHPTIKFPLSN